MAPVVLTEAELKTLSRDLARSFERAGELSAAVPGDRFDSHTSTFYELTPPGGTAPIALIKVGRGWDAAEARRVYDDIVALARLVGQGGSALGVAEPMGWHTSPPSICVRYVPGEDLGRLLRSGDPDTSLGFEPVIRACGEALGRFHSQSPTTDLTLDPAAIRTGLEAMARAVMVRPAFLATLDLVGSSARRYGDFAPYNVRIDAEGGAWIIDQPSPPALEPVHRDVAWFLFNLERRLGWDVPVDPARCEQVKSSLVEAFHEGYRATGPVPLDTPADRALLALYRAHRSLWTARRRLRQRELGEIPAYLRLALHWRKRVSETG
jgi:hypothetical protein